MTSSSGKSCIVFNGEIYNYQELRKDLERKGFLFVTNSDTEVILNAYECWGMETTLSLLDGMFAFALYDRHEQVLALARDRFGKKPLYLYHQNQRLCFSSDIRSFAAIKSVPRELDMYALGYFFAELTTPYEHTIWKAIRKLRPGHYLVFGNQGVKTYARFADVHYTERCELDREQIIAHTDRLLTTAVEKRLVGDVEAAGLLSGGIDSSLVVAKMAEQKSGRVRTYSVGFNEQSFNELPYARQVAQKFDTDHTEISLQPQDLRSVYELIGEFGEPFADVSMVPTYWISREIAKKEKVVLGGDGGDELFAGYESYFFAHKFDHYRNYHAFLPLVNLFRKVYPSYHIKLLEKIFRHARRPAHHLLDRNMAFDREGLKNLVDDDIFREAVDTEHRFIWDAFAVHSPNDVINLMSASLKTRLLNDYLVKVDRASMFASLEMRTPFLDKDLAQFAATLKPFQLFYSGPKSILKDIALRYFSEEFVNRQKMGFSVPLASWLRNALSDDVSEIILGGRQNLVELNYPYIERLIEDHNSGAADYGNRIWSLLTFHIWARNQ